jgi:murein L,D-transpeptidase YafK
MKKSFILVAIASFLLIRSYAQDKAFIDFQKSFPRVSEAFKHTEDSLKRQFKAKGVEWPCKYIYIRSFKYDSQLEVWAKNAEKETYKLIKTYYVCALAGSMGPKRFQGDYQVPEGFYSINEFKPNSNYHLGLGLNYPNASDHLLSDSANPGDDILIHGSCTTVGCIPIKDKPIEELYVLSVVCKNAGLDFIPVHIFPIRYNNRRSFNYLAVNTRSDQELQKFHAKLKEAYDLFERYKQPPIVMVNSKGEYVFQEVK